MLNNSCQFKIPAHMLNRNSAHDVTIVYDVTDKESFNHVKAWMGEIDKQVSDSFNKLVIENKFDLTSQEELSTDEAKNLPQFVLSSFSSFFIIFFMFDHFSSVFDVSSFFLYVFQKNSLLALVLTTLGGIAGIWVGPPTWVRACFNSQEWGGSSSPVKTEPLQIVFSLLLFWTPIDEEPMCTSHKATRRNCAGALDGQQLLAIEGSQKKKNAESWDSTPKKSPKKWRKNAEKPFKHRQTAIPPLFSA